MWDAHQIPRRKDMKGSDYSFMQLLTMDVSNLSHDLSLAFLRPAYAYTKASVGGINNASVNV